MKEDDVTDVRRRAGDRQQAPVMRTLLHSYIPAQFHDPVGLTKRLLRSRNPAALFAMATALLGFVCIPFDLLLQFAENWRYRTAPPPRFPLIFVVGPPRSGTTLVAQVLIKHLPVSYINNLTSVFPRSPITANLAFGMLKRTQQIRHTSYYGKTTGFSGPNDSLYIWDRWLGKDRTSIPTALSDTAKRDMVRFFGAFQEAFSKPLVNKINRLNTCSHLVAHVLKGSYFISLTRDPVYLAQSLLQARLDIHGDPNLAYGATNPDKETSNSSDYIASVCDQVRFHQAKIREQQRIIGAERFWIISYEDFCEKPEELVRRVSEEILNRPVNTQSLAASIEPFEISNRVKVDSEIFAHIKNNFACHN